MSALNEIVGYLIQTALSLYLLVMLLRFLLHASQADFYNPVSQFVVKVTNPALAPLRRLLPPVGRFDLAALVESVLLQALGIVLLLLLNGVELPNITLILAWSVVGVVALLVNIYFFALLAMIILSWVARGSRHPAILLIYQITEPVMAPVRRLLPPMGGIDFSPILVFILINVVQIALRHIGAGIGLHPALVMGL
ncbi:MAG: YggT family protein [Chromatocurvus sp.]